MFIGSLGSVCASAQQQIETLKLMTSDQTQIEVVPLKKAPLTVDDTFTGYVRPANYVDISTLNVHASLSAPSNSSTTAKRRGSRSSAVTDTDGDGILDSLDLCPDHMDTALDFDGIDDFVTVPHDPALNVGTGDFTFEAWLNPSSNQYIPILKKAFSPSTGTNYTFDITPATSSTYNIRLFYANDIYLNTTQIP